MFMGTIKPQVYIKFNPQLLPAQIGLVENQPMDHVGHKIKTALEAKGITQMALAELVGVSNNAVTKWVKTGKVAKENIPKVAAALGMSIADFFDGPEDDLVHAIYLLQDKKLRQLLYAAEPLSDYKKDVLISTSHAFAEQPRQNDSDKK